MLDQESRLKKLVTATEALVSQREDSYAQVYQLIGEHLNLAPLYAQYGEYYKIYEFNSEGQYVFTEQSSEL